MKPRIPTWEVAVVLVLIVATSAGVMLYSSTLPSPTCPPTGTAGVCPEVRGNISYAIEELTIPSNGVGFGPLTSVTFHGAGFRIWPEVLSPWDVYLQGTAAEPGGVDLAFVVFWNISQLGGNPPLTNASVRTWFSPDGVLGVTWLSFRGNTIGALLAVSDPLIRYASENVTLDALKGSNDSPQTFVFHGVNFSLQVYGWYSPAGPSLNATAHLANGTVVYLGIWDGPLFACGLIGDTPSGILGNATCLESGDVGLGLALLWNGDLSVTLMIRVG